MTKFMYSINKDLTYGHDLVLLIDGHKISINKYSGLVYKQGKKDQSITKNISVHNNEISVWADIDSSIGKKIRLYISYIIGNAKKTLKLKDSAELYEFVRIKDTAANPKDEFDWVFIEVKKLYM